MRDDCTPSASSVQARYDSKSFGRTIPSEQSLSLELIAGLCELLGLSSQLAKTATSYVNSVEAPAVLFFEDVPVVFYGVKRGNIVIAHPNHGIQKLTLEEFRTKLDEKFRFMLPRRVASTPTSRFGWNWFTPLLKNIRLR